MWRHKHDHHDSGSKMKDTQIQFERWIEIHVLRKCSLWPSSEFGKVSSNYAVPCCLCCFDLRPLSAASVAATGRQMYLYLHLAVAVAVVGPLELISLFKHLLIVC